METYAGTHRPTTATRSDRLGGTAGNERLTIAAGVILTVLLIAEGITLLKLNGLLSVHMFIGLVLIPPVLLKLASTGYRMARYYTNSRRYVEKGPPPLALRLMAPVLVAATVGIFATGVWLLALGQKSNQVVFLHQAFFAVWAFAFGIHFLAHLPRMASSLLGPRVPGSWSAWLGESERPRRRERVPGSGLR
ncbi:MAG: hypothetical protein WBV53_12420, partial [Solirubrobacterales bacterium]